jgi:hypothetical protein
LNTDKLK